MLTVLRLTELLRAHGLRLSKRLGQHHLVDAAVCARIVDACRLSADDTVLEIGAGLGALTEGLAGRAGRVIAIEVDRGVCALLAERARAWPNVEIRCADILDVTWERLRDVVVVGAIPYHITSPILVWLAEHRARTREAILIMQREVAQRLMARPGTKAYGRLSVLATYCWSLQPLLAISRRAFFPSPEVDSLCVRLTPHARPPVKTVSEARLFALVKAAFATRRKTLINSLSREATREMPRARVEAALRQLDLPLTVRGEALSLEQFAALADMVSDTFSPKSV